MIDFAKTDLTDQAGMERAFRRYADQVREEFGSSFNGMLNASLAACDYDGRSVTLAVAAQPWMANPNGVVHGGVTASVMDLAMGLASRFFSGGRLTPTVNLNVSYLRPVPLEGRLMVRAVVTSCGFHMCAVTAEAWMDGAGSEPVATAAGTYYVNRKKP